MPPKRGGRGGAAAKRTTPVKATPEEAKKVKEEPAKEEKEEMNMDEMQVMDEVKDEGEANGDAEGEGGEEFEGEGEEAAEEGNNGEAGEETPAAEGEEKTKEEGGEKDEKKEGEAKEGKKDAKRRPRFNPHNRTVAVHEYHVDRLNNVHDRTVMIGPTNLDDLQNEKLISYLTTKAVQFFIRYACKPDVKGHVEIRFKTADEAKEAAEDLQTIREGLIANQNNEEFQNSEKSKELKNLWGSHDEGSAAQRTLVLKGLPKDVTLEQLEEKIPDATQIIMPHRGSPATFPGFCYVEFPTAELVEKMLKNEEKMKFPDPENPEEEKETVYKKFDPIPHSDLLIKKIDTQHFDKPFMSIPHEAKQESLNQLISACAYFERNSFLLRQKRMDTIKKKKQMLISRRDEIRKMQRAQNKKNRNMNRGRTGGPARGGAIGGHQGGGGGRGGGGGGRGGGRNDRGSRGNDRRPMKRFNDRSPRGGGGGGNFGNKRMRRDSYGRGDDRGPMPSGPRIPRDAWQSNNWNSGGMGGGGGSGFNNSGMGSMGMGGGGGGGYGSGMGMRGGMDMGGYNSGGGGGGGGMGHMDYNSGPSDYYDDGSMRGTMGGGGMNTYSSGGGGFTSSMGEYDDMGQDSYGNSGGGGSGGYSQGAGGYGDSYDSYNTAGGTGGGGGGQRGKGSLNPQQAANAVNLLVGLSSLMGSKGQGGSTGGRYGGSSGGIQKGGRWGGGRN